MKQIFSTASCLGLVWAASCAPGNSAQGQGATLAFDHTDFTLSPTFNRLRDFAFSIQLTGPITPGLTADNPALAGVDYSVFGILDTDPTPSGFTAFNLQRTIGGSEFYDQGSSLRFTVSPTADLSNGLQLSELVSDAPTSPIFQFNGREVDTGRYHPTLLQLFANGTGRIQNSNNTGGVNPSTNQVVDVTFGEEYIVELAFDPASITLVAADAIPEPASLAIVALGGLALLSRQRRQ